MANVTTGVSAHCFANFDAEVHLPLLADRGVDLFEIAVCQYDVCNDDAAFDRLCALLANNGIQTNSLHMPYGQGDPFMFLDFSSPDPSVRDQAVEVGAHCARRLAQAGGKYLVIHPGGDLTDEPDRPARVEQCAKTLWQLRDRLPDGVQIAIEILPRTMLCRGVPETLSLLERLDDDAFGLCLDVNHIFLEPIPEAMAAYAPHALTTHISDHDGVDERHWLPGRGVIPWPQLIDTLTAGGFTGPYMYETGDPGGATAAESVDIIVDNIHKIFGDDRTDA